VGEETAISPLGTHPAATDLLLPRPAAGEAWDAHLIHTHYFGFSVAEAAIGAFIYIRYHPAFGMCHGGVSIFRGLENPAPLDAEFLDYEITMPWPRVEANTITTDNGLRIEFLELGARIRISYAAPDGAMAFDVVQEAVTPILMRGHILPGEDERSDAALGPGGMEQIMRCTGTLDLHGERFEIDCHEARDRSWNQIRTERRGAVVAPPLGWSPMWFGPDLAFNQIGFEAPDTDPAWAGLFDMPADQPTHHWGWAYVDGEARHLRRVRRDVLEYHPQLHAALRQDIEAEDETGQVHRFSGEAIAMAPVPAWPNVGDAIAVYRWSDEQGRESVGTYQEVWFDSYQRVMTRRDRAVAP